MFDFEEFKKVVREHLFTIPWDSWAFTNESTEEKLDYQAQATEREVTVSFCEGLWTIREVQQEYFKNLGYNSWVVLTWIGVGGSLPCAIGNMELKQSEESFRD